MPFPRFYNLKLKERRKETSDTYTFVFESGKEPKWTAGQHFFFNFKHANPDDRGYFRVYTILAAPHEGNLMFSTRYFGKKSSSFKRALMKIPMGGKMKAFGPSPVRDYYKINDLSRSHIMIMGGIGVTPARSVLADLDHRGDSLKGKMLYANGTDQFAFKQELEQIVSKMPDFHIEYFVSPNRIGDATLLKCNTEFPQAIYYLSGSPSFVTAMKENPINMGIIKKDIRHDSFGISLFGKLLRQGYK